MAEKGDVELESLSDGAASGSGSSNGGESEAASLVRIDISRTPQNEVKFETGNTRLTRRRAIRDRLRSIPEPVRSALTPPLTREAWLEFVFVHIPILRWLLSYQLAYLVSDIVSGITVAIMHIPQGLAYAILANLPPVYGLYASFVPTIIYSFLGSSRHISVGTFAVVELMIGNSINRIIQDLPCAEYYNNSNATGSTSSLCVSSDDTLDANMTSRTVDCEAEKARIAVTIAMVSGVIMLVMGLLQLGFISIFLSQSLVSGYTTGAAVHVFTSQLTHILGIPNSVSPGLFQVPRIWIKTFSVISKTNVATLLIAVVSMATLIGFKFLNKYLKKLKVPLLIYSSSRRKIGVKWVKWTIPIPAPLVVLVVATLLSFLASFEENFDVIIVGDIPQGVPDPTNPFTEYISLSLIIDSFVIAIVVYSVSVSLARKFAVQHDYTIHSNQEFIAYGMMNIAGSFFSSFTAAASLSRSLIQSNGGKTQLVGFISSAIILVVLLWLGPLFEPLPRAVLAATIWVALWGMFSQVKDALSFLKLSPYDFVIWVVVFLATVLLGVDMGLAVGVGVSLLLIIFRLILPYTAVLGQASNTEIFRNTKNFKVETMRDVLIFRFMAPICFINASVFRTRLEMECGLHKRRPSHGNQKGCLQKPLPSVEQVEQCCGKSEGYSVGDVRRRRGGSDGKEEEPCRVRSVVIDCAPIAFLDAVGVTTLKELVDNFDKFNVQVLFAAMTEENRNMMDRAKFYEVCGKEWLFPTIQDAVHHARFSQTLHPARGSETEMTTEEEEEKKTSINLEANGGVVTHHETEFIEETSTPTGI